MKKLLLFLGLPLFLYPEEVWAHAFGQAYTLSLPLWLYFYGAGSVLVLSFLLAGIFFRNFNRTTGTPEKNISQSRLGKFLINGNLRFFLRVLSLIIFFVILVSGFTGSSEPIQNFASVFVWIIFLLGLTYFTAIFGNIWSLMNPWKIMVEIYESFRGEIKPRIKSFDALSFSLALFFYFVFIWFEFLSSGLGAQPRATSFLVVIYTLINFLGVYIYGRENWFKYGDFFGVLFNIYGSGSLFNVRGKKSFVRFPFTGLINQNCKSFSLVVFILLILSSTAFDGFKGTVMWLGVSNFFIPLTSLFGERGEILLQTIFLIITCGSFLLLYFGANFFMKVLTKSKFSTTELSYIFIFTLVPIALVYNGAHYFTLLLIQGQQIIPLISDPFNQGWNIFGTSGYQVNAGVIGAKAVWNSQVGLIVIGHIAAVLLAHFKALEIFPNHRKALLSQLPMLILMVIYTITGLWILSQPYRLGG